MKSKETTRKTCHWIKKLEAHAVAIGQDGPLLSFGKETLNKILCSFIMSLKKENGDEYEIPTMHTAMSILKKHLKDNKCGNIEEDDEFRGVRDVRDAKLKAMKQAGKGNRPYRAEALTQKEEAVLFERGELGTHNPKALTRTMWWQMSLLLGFRGRDESRKMLWGDIQLKADEDGGEYLEFNERTTKTRDGGSAGGSREYAPKAFENKENPQRYPVKTYKEFAKRRPAEAMKEESPFFLATNHKATGDIWFMNSPLGKNQLGSLQYSRQLVRTLE